MRGFVLVRSSGGLLRSTGECPACIILKDGLHEPKVYLRPILDPLSLRTAEKRFQSIRKLSNSKITSLIILIQTCIQKSFKIHLISLLSHIHQNHCLVNSSLLAFPLVFHQT